MGRRLDPNLSLLRRRLHLRRIGDRQRRVRGSFAPSSPTAFFRERSPPSILSAKDRLGFDGNLEIRRSLPLRRRLRLLRGVVHGHGRHLNSKDTNE